MERSPRMERTSPRTKRSPQVSRSPRKTRTPDRRQSTTSDVLRRMALTSSAHKLEREKTRSKITPRSMINEYLSTQQTAEPIVRQKRHATSLEPERAPKKTKVSVDDEETPRTIMHRFLNELQTQTPVVRQVRRRHSEQDIYVNEVVERKRESDSFLADDEDEENIVPNSQPVQTSRITEKSYKTKAIRDSFVADQIEQLRRIEANVSGAASNPGQLKRRDMSKFASHLTTIIHDSSPSPSTETTPESSQMGRASDSRADDLVEDSEEPRQLASNQKKISTSIRESFGQVDDVEAEERCANHIDAHSNASHRDDASEGSSIRQDHPTSVSGIEMIPSSDIEEDAASLHQEFDRLPDGESPIIPIQTPSKLVRSRRSSGISVPEPLVSAISTPLSERRTRMTNAFEPMSVVRRVSKGSRSMTPKSMRGDRSIDRSPRNSSLTPEARSVTPLERTAPVSTTRSRESTTEAGWNRGRQTTPRSRVTSATPRTPQSAMTYANKSSAVPSTSYLVPSGEKRQSPSTSRAMSPPPDPKPKRTSTVPVVIGAPANIYDFFGQVERRVTQKVTQTRRTSGSSVKVPPKNTATPRKSPTKTKTKSKKKEIGMSTASMRAMFKHLCRFPVAQTAFEEIESVCEQFYENSASDLSAFSAHAGRQYVTCDDMILLMKRQRFITEKESLYSLVEKNLPLEYREKIIPMAISGNKLTGTALMKRGKRSGRKRSSHIDDIDEN